MVNYNKIDWKKVLAQGVIKCEVCGKQFGTKLQKQKHLEGHIISAKKRGLEPRYSYNPKTGEENFIGFKSAFDIY